MILSNKSYTSAGQHEGQIRGIRVRLLVIIGGYMRYLVSFKKGKQPCNDFKGQIEHHEHGSWENRHQCYKCGGIVSFCENCYKDHHDNGYETCKEVK